MTTPDTTGPAPAGDVRGRPRVVVLSGNPRRGSRTTAAAQTVADAVARVLGSSDPAEVVELADLAPEVLLPEHPRVDDALATLAAADVAIVATPVYKASYTGLLKAFLDLYRAGDLAATVAVPLVVAGAPAHLLAGEVHLRPLLVELGAVVPTRAVALTEAQLGDLDAAVDAWLSASAPALTAAVAGVRAARRGTSVDAGPTHGAATPTLDLQEAAR